MDRETDLALSNGGANSAQASPKRKADGAGNSPVPRAKRNRYISIACNECKRRKIKCNGQTPCQRCGNLSLECQYAPNCCNLKDSEEFQSMKSHISSLQEQVDTLYANLNSLRQIQDKGSPVVDPSLYSTEGSNSLSLPQNGNGPKLPRYRGPSSSAFNLDVAKSSLQTMGITPIENGMEEVPATQQGTPAGSPAYAVHPDKDPLWSLKREEAIRLCRVYEDEIGVMYPVLDVNKVIDQTNLLYKFMEAALRTGLAQRTMPGADQLSNDDIDILKMVLAATLIVEGGGQSHLGSRLFESVRPSIERRMWAPADLKGVKLLFMVATYWFHIDDDAQAWRYAGLAARLGLEMGLHRRDALRRCVPNDEDFMWAIRLFWSVYILERRFSFGTGMPFAIQDADIDPLLPEPDPSVPYLKSMIAYCRLSSRVWYSGLGFSGSMDIKKDEIGFLDYQVLQWHKDIPPSLSCNPSDPCQESEQVGRGLRRLRVVIYLRFLHMRILIHRPLLHSASSIHENRATASTAVELAKECIRTLTRLNATTDIYRTQQTCFNYFLVSALAVLFLAVSHDPVNFNRVVRDEFYMALDLVKGFSTKSYVSKRLWDMIRGLREIGEKLGLISRVPGPNASDAHSNAAVAMAGLAGHPMEELTVYPNLQGMNGLSNSPMNGLQMSNELTNLFEAVGGYGAEGVSGVFMGPDGEMQPGIGYEEEFLRVMRDLF